MVPRKYDICLGIILIFSFIDECYGCASHVRLAADKVANYVSSKGRENCTWLIIASSPDKVVRIDFEDVNMSEYCSVSEISIYDGSSFNTRRLGISCEDPQSAYESSGRYMLLHIRTNKTNDGFIAKYYMFSKEESASSDAVTIVGGIIGGLILLSLATTIICTLKNHNVIPSVMGGKRQHPAKQKVGQDPSNLKLPKTSVVASTANYMEPITYTTMADPPSTDLITPISFVTPPSLEVPPPVDFITPTNYPSALQASNSKSNRTIPGHPFDESDNQGTSYAENHHYTSTKSILSPGGYISTQSSSFESFE